MSDPKAEPTAPAEAPSEQSPAAAAAADEAQTAELMQRSRRARELATTVEELRQEIAWREQQLGEREQEILRLQWTDAELRHELVRLERHLDILEHSRSFRLTAPLRQAVSYLKAIADGGSALRARLGHGIRLRRAGAAGPTTATATARSLQPVAVDVGGQAPSAATRPGRPVTIAEEERVAVLAHPPCELTYRLTVPARAMWRAHVALLPEIWDRNIGGVDFRLRATSADGTTTATRTGRSNPARYPHHRRWLELVLSLAQFAGQEVTLTLTTSVPEHGLAHFGWALWADPEIVVDDAAAYRLAGPAQNGSEQPALPAAPANGGPSYERGPARARVTDPGDDYRRWIARHEPDAERQRELAAEQATWTTRPLVSVVVPVLDPAEEHLEQCLASVTGQLYDNWQLCLADGGSTDPAVRRRLEQAAAADPRVRLALLDENRGIAGNTNAAIELATGAFLAFLDHDDRLAPWALYEVVRLLNERPDLDLVYSDEDKIDAVTGVQRHSPHFKPSFSPDTLLSHNYLNHLTVIRTALVRRLGGFRGGFEGSQDYDLYLRALEQTDRVAHVPQVLYHWRAVRGSAAADREAKPHAYVAAKSAIQDRLDREDIDARVVDGKFLGSYRVRYPVPETASVEIIIPTKDRVDLLRPCIESIVEKTDHPAYRITVVDHCTSEAGARSYLERLASSERVRVLDYRERAFNFSAINNLAAGRTSADCLVFLNNDTEVIDAGWLTALLEHALRPGVGAVGAKLLFGDDHVQHAGVIVGLGGLAGHAHLGLHASEPGYFGRADLVQNVTAVTGACLALRREVFEAAGGFDESLAVAFNDVDLCLRLRRDGYAVIYTPYALLYHHESRSRGTDMVAGKRDRFEVETAVMSTRWRGALAACDPFYNPNLSLDALRSFELGGDEVTLALRRELAGAAASPTGDGTRPCTARRRRRRASLFRGGPGR